MSNITIRPIQTPEIADVASLISTGFYNDIFFKWVVDKDEDRHRIITEYYKIYLNAKGTVCHVAENKNKEIVGATVWLPHDVDTSIYSDIDEVAGIHAPNFKAVADKSHDNEPTGTPFYQLVGIVVDKKAQGAGISNMLLGYQINILDAQGIPTYLEASTPYDGGGMYGKFGYQPFGQLMHFTQTAVLYPLWRPVPQTI